MRAYAREVAAWCGGQLHGDDTLLVGVSQDSRRLLPGALFVALRGEHVDGHDFLPALVGTAGAALVERLQPALALPQILVGDVLGALQRLARCWLDSLQCTVLALTGSNGKTTTKNLSAAILARHARIHATPGNYNNEIGVPLTVLGIGADHRLAVIEMGCGKPGDIDELVAIAPPHVALVTNVAPAHLERLGSVEEVARSKAGIYRGLRAGGHAIVNAEDAYAEYFRGQAAGKAIMDFAIDRPAAVRAEALQLGLRSRFRLCTPAGSADLELPLPGRHNVLNALAATAFSLAAGAPLSAIVAGLSEAEAVPGRQRRERIAGAVVYDDSYNANPGSLAAAIQTLALEPSPRWLVLGDMGELGANAAALHAQCGALAREYGIDRLYAIGPLSASACAELGDAARHFEDIADLIAQLRTDLAASSETVHMLVKGSRSARMERVLAALSGRPEGGH